MQANLIASLVSNLQDYAFLLLDHKGRILTWNSNAEKITKYTADQVCGQYLTYLQPSGHKTDLESEYDFITRFPQSQVEGERWFQRADHQLFLGYLAVAPVHDTTGTLTNFAVMIHNITHYLHTEDRFRVAVEAAPNAMVMVDKQGKIVLVNSQTEILFGYPRQELIGQRVEILVPERYRQSHPTYRNDFFSSPQARPMGAGRDLYGRRKDGQEMAIEIGLNPLITEEGSFVLASIIDITERKRAEEKFRVAVEAAPNAMVMVDKQGKIVLVNSQTEILFGYPRQELINHHLEMLVPERYRQGHPTYRNDFFINPHARPMGAGRDLYGRRKDGQEIAIEIGLNPLITEEGAFVLASIIDITERKRTEEQIKASLLEKEVLLKEIHHRVKNNLQLVSSLLQLQSGYIKNVETLGLFQESQDRIRSIAIIHEKLYQSESLAKVDFAEYISSLTSLLLHTYSSPKNPVKLETKITAIPIGIDLAVPVGLILNELLTNILKYAFPDNRQGKIQISLEPDAEKRLILTVSDDGVGMPDTVKVQSPTTLGLRLVKILAKQLAAEVTFHTSTAGTSFQFLFPDLN
ncbi:MAG TPA: PAS domain S-box protein [Acidobacteriota bacterium]|nr:PAS domain S-box protein [Acidobacteriota bacterium]HNB71371.1 PAS domain S-box protein [Acidobacteriota bacterium]HNC42801.1 PAS domain S-box protein [Acidobacteriota bacterium]